jgi:hypothetical protein
MAPTRGWTQAIGRVAEHAVGDIPALPRNAPVAPSSG